MESINFTFLGDESILKDFAKKGTSSDITLYDRKDSDIIRTWAAPTGFPEKIQPLFQTINMGEYVILYVTKLDKFTGEQIIALDVLGKSNGILVHSYDVDREKLLMMIKGTVVENYKIVDLANLKTEIDAFPALHKDGPAEILMDSCFDVKGVGTVVLGKVIQGKVKQYDNLTFLPKGSEVLVKSIQMHDDNVPEANSPGRVGLSVKGLSPDDVQRGDILSASPLQVKQDITLDYKPNKYFREEIGQNQTFIANIGLQIKAVKILSMNPMKLSLIKPSVIRDDDVCVILKPESQSMRIVGSGKTV
ncbi:MAG: elongation factor Tu [Candidatus Aenigmarchaeota archaeon]|nr:elongation factor Tu [Candidatus Aenigmarchaeota archaeon]